MDVLLLNHAEVADAHVKAEESHVLCFVAVAILIVAVIHLINKEIRTLIVKTIC